MGALWTLELFGASIKLIGSSPSAIRRGNGSLWVADSLGRFDAGSAGATPRLGGHQGSPWFDPRGPLPPVLPEYCVGPGTARQRQLVEAGAGLPVRSTTARALPLAAAATQVCIAPRRGGEGYPPGLHPRVPSVPSTCRRAAGVAYNVINS